MQGDLCSRFWMPYNFITIIGRIESSNKVARLVGVACFMFQVVLILDKVKIVFLWTTEPTSQITQFSWD